MQVTKQPISPTETSYKVSADAEQLQKIKERVLRSLSHSVKIQGFRSGKAPLALVEKSVDPAQLQTSFVDDALNELWAALYEQENVRPVAQPKVSLDKFVPFTTLEVTYAVSQIGKIELPDYKRLRVAKPKVSVVDTDVTEVLDNLRNRAAEAKAVTRAAKDGDEVTIDFTGTDAKSGDAIDGAAGTDYPIVIGSNTFIPGFEPELIGLKAGDSKTFAITFPADYGVKDLQKRKVSFDVTAKEVKERRLPKLDDAFAATVGPFKTLTELKADIKKQLQTEREAQAERDYQSEVLGQLAEKAKADIPDSLIDTEIDRIEAEERQNLAYRGQTWQEHLKEEGVSEAEHRERQREGAAARVKAGLVLGEVADQEGIAITRQEIDERLAALRQQYKDAAMQAELDKPETRQEIGSRLLTEKTIKLLTSYASGAA